LISWLIFVSWKLLQPAGHQDILPLSKYEIEKALEGHALRFSSDAESSSLLQFIQRIIEFAVLHFIKSPRLGALKDMARPISSTKHL